MTFSSSSSLSLALIYGGLLASSPSSALGLDHRFQSLPCIQEAPGRLATAEKLLAAIASTPNYNRPALPDYEDYFASLAAFPSNFSATMKNVGYYEGANAVADFNALALPDLSGGSIEYLYREIIDLVCIDESQDASPGSNIKVVFNQTVKQGRHAEPITYIEYYDLAYAPSSDLLLHYYGSAPKELVDAMVKNLPSPQEMCNEAILRCQGGLFPFESLDECYRIMSSLPDQCDANCPECRTINGPFHGDTRLCRSLPLLSAGLRPTLHCAHIADVSEKCFKDACPSATRHPLTEVDKDLEMFDPTLSLWMRILEIIVGSLFILIPIGTYSWYRWTRVTAFQQLQTTKEQTQTELDVTTGSIATVKAPAIFPFLRLEFCMSLCDKESTVVLSSDNMDFGACKMSALVGPSGCGKSTFMKLLCGHSQSHMKLELSLLSNPCPLVYLPQYPDMWPKTMSVRDIILFVCTMHGCKPGDYARCFETLGLVDLMDKRFGLLSGGQQQRVHTVTALMRPSPSIIFLDEPLSSLDEENAVACIKLLKALPIDHSFVLSVHQMSPKLKAEFDRVIEVQANGGQGIRKVHMSQSSKKMSQISKTLSMSSGRQSSCLLHKSSSSSDKPIFSPSGSAKVSQSDQTQYNEAHNAHIRNYQSTFDGISCLLILWHGQFNGWPVLEIAAVVISSISGIVLGFPGGESMDDGKDTGYIATDLALFVPYEVMQMILTVVLISAFGVALVFAGNEKDILLHFVQERDLKPRAVVVANFLRLGLFSLLQSVCNVVITFGVMDLLQGDIDTFIFNFAFFGMAYLFICYTLGLAFPNEYAPQAVLLSYLSFAFFSGTFFEWDNLSDYWKLLHLINPFFYTMQACINLVYFAFDANCDDTAHPYLICAEGSTLLNISGVQEFGSDASQLSSAILLVVIIGALWLVLYPFASVRDFEVAKTNKDDNDGSLDDSARVREPVIHESEWFGQTTTVSAPNSGSKPPSMKAWNNIDSSSWSLLASESSFLVPEKTRGITRTGSSKSPADLDVVVDTSSVEEV